MPQDKRHSIPFAGTFACNLARGLLVRVKGLQTADLNLARNWQIDLALAGNTFPSGINMYRTLVESPHANDTESLLSFTESGR